MFNIITMIYQSMFFFHFILLSHMQIQIVILQPVYTWIQIQFKIWILMGI